jgi:hypothetical protein
MGLLDDAIREHLDLKRRRGADPSEIAREESEALGPVRRGEPADEAAALAVDDLEGPYDDDEPALDEPARGYADDGYAYEPEPEPAPTPPPAPPRRDEPAAREPELPEPAEPPQTHADAYAERESETATPPHGDPLAHQQTREFSAYELDEALAEDDQPAERAPARKPADADDDAADEDEDVLEETPDFLQETPEHDRLWFEQKPPKDFDF